MSTKRSDVGLQPVKQMKRVISHERRFWMPLCGVVLAAMIVAFTTYFEGKEAEAASADPAAWGDDHVGKPLPIYMTGDECLFCHRVDVGETWQSNRHNTGMRIVDLVPERIAALLKSPEAESFGPAATYVLGGEWMLRFLKPNGKYGQFGLHEARWEPQGAGKLAAADGHWNEAIFAQSCAGCHTTAVETEIQAFAAPSLDCFVCHGDVPAGHQNVPTEALFAKKREAESLVEMSICGQCHLRGGRAKSSGLPYPNQFVPGDNLFRDFEVDWSDTATAAMAPDDGHIFANMRDVVIGGQLDMTCTTCHDIHNQSSRKHRVLPKHERVQYCAICHTSENDYKQLKAYSKRSALCQY